MASTTNTNTANKTDSLAGKLGRRGDPRMHKAVAARVDNPELPLLDALKQGGFIFPSAEEGNDATLVDADGVTLGQRKNQLSRRIRLARQDGQKQQQAGGGTKMQPPAQQVPPPRVTNNKRAASMISITEDDVDMSDDMANLQRMAKYHPQFHPLFSTVRPGTTDTSTQRVSLSPPGHTSGVAVASLISTSNSVGMTLEQLAMRLADAPNLFQALSSNPDPDQKLELAINLFATDARALLQKCMLLAGFDGTAVTEGSSSYMQIALKAWEIEGKRLETLLGCAKHNDDGEFCDCLPGVGDSSATVTGLKKSAEELRAKHGTSSSSAWCASSSSNPAAAAIDVDAIAAHAAEGRHVHRLSGKCGHKAIIHQPNGRPAHIDFVVDGKIECYEGIRPVGPRGQGALWPSRYKCADLACPSDQHELACGSSVCNQEAVDAVNGTAPKQLSLTDVDFDGKEWNVDFFSHDGQDDTLLGLVQLGGGDNPE